jgi:hypothetical protein
VSTHTIIRDYDGCRPIYEPAVYIHLFAAQTKPKPLTLLQRLGAFLRRQVTTTRNK